MNTLRVLNVISGAVLLASSLLQQACTQNTYIYNATPTPDTAPPAPTLARETLSPTPFATATPGSVATPRPTANIVTPVPVFAPIPTIEISGPIVIQGMPGDLTWYYYIPVPQNLNPQDAANRIRNAAQARGIISRYIGTHTDNGRAFTAIILPLQTDGAGNDRNADAFEEILKGMGLQVENLTFPRGSCTYGVLNNPNLTGLTAQIAIGGCGGR